MTIYGWLQLGALALFLCLAAARAIRIGRRRHVNAFAIRPDHNRWRWALEISFFVAVNVWAIELALVSVPGGHSLFPAGLGRGVLAVPLLRPTGALMVVVGLGLDITGLAALGESWRLGVDERRPGELVTAGVYRLTRNPIYLFFNLFFWGVFLINGTPAFLLFALLGGANLHLQVLEEERFLEEVHGERYRQYRRAVGRYWTFRRVD